MPLAMNTSTATSERAERRPNPHTPWPLVQPPPMRVPNPTSSPAAATHTSGKPWRSGTGAPAACQASPASSKPEMNQARHCASGGEKMPCRIPLTPAILPLAASSQTLARPMSAPPASAEIGVKSCI